jgi:hypothetical protein
LLAVLHFIPDSDDPAGIVATLASALVPGSYLVISHLTADLAPVPVAAGVGAYNEMVPTGVTPRTHPEVTALFGGLPLVPPGVVPVTEWRPGTGPAARADLYAGMGALPDHRTCPVSVNLVVQVVRRADCRCIHGGGHASIWMGHFASRSGAASRWRGVGEIATGPIHAGARSLQNREMVTISGRNT